MQNKKMNLVVLGIIVLVGVFYGGMVYGKNQISAIRTQAFGSNGGGQRGTGGFRNGGGFTTGQIISKDATSITVSLMGGGSKIIFLDSNTKISKSTSGTVGDLVTGAQVSVMGVANADGSVNAQSVQIRPSMATAVVK